MPIKTDKPDIESFVRKDETPAPKEPKHEGQGKDKTFLLHLPYDLWYRLKMEALQEGKPLHQFIIEILGERARK